MKRQEMVDLNSDSKRKNAQRFRSEVQNDDLILYQSEVGEARIEVRLIK
jgi:hypothetical protein